MLCANLNHRIGEHTQRCRCLEAGVTEKRVHPPEKPAERGEWECHHLPRLQCGLWLALTAWHVKHDRQVLFAGQINCLNAVLPL